ncbi:hypothetical protein [Microbaculum marinisediminis]|uniref:Uncharacterized protein n=1 Tax=Microbaculum marinisediminis TaxID=2931392 RepID=A0AAW5QVP9_9HYPH|nr:hypothetical protein [Microbaculum sp. A6E488]MCT8971778.1 hypothetical protein [Microbaculum sp. A6E488]
MIENIVVFALGALVATLLALLVIPVIWRRAARLIEERIRATTPLSMAEIQSEKDLIRADYAVQLRKVEVRYEEEKGLAAEREIELGRRQGRVNELEAELDARELAIAEQDERIEELQGTVLGLERQISSQTASLKEKQHLISEGNDTLREVRAQLTEAAGLADSRKVEIAALKTQLENHKSRIEEMRAELATRAIEAEERGSAVDELSGALKGREARIALLNSRVARRRDVSLERRKRAKELQALLEAQRERVAEKTAALSAAALKQLKQDEDIKILEEERAALKKVIADFEAKLEIKDREIARLGQRGGTSGAASSAAAMGDGDAAQLRESIADLAARITRQAAEQGDDEVRALIDAVSPDGQRVPSRKTGAGRSGGARTPLAERIKEADLTPGE